MEKILLISQDSSIEERLGDLLGSPRHLDRVSDWPEAHRVMTRSTPNLVLVGPEMLSLPLISEIVRLNNILVKEQKKAIFLVDPNDQQVRESSQMFPSVTAVVTKPTTPAQWQELGQTLSPLLAISSSPSDARASTKSAPAPQMVIRVPPIDRGSLENIALSRLLYLLSLRKATGLLHLQSGNVRKRFGFHIGRFAAGPDADSADALNSAFAWPRGQFVFEPLNEVSGDLTPVSPLIRRGLVTHRPQRQLMDALMPLMATFPTRTHLWAPSRSEHDWPLLSEFLAHCNGEQTLEGVLSAMAPNVTEAFRVAIFGGDTDLIVFRAEKTTPGISIQYDFQGEVPPSHESSSSDDTSASESKASRATGAGRLELEKELRLYLDQINRMSPHQVFGIWEGCGREVVKETFYRMVKEHHPDVYGGNVSGGVKSLAQKIFMNIRKQYAELMKVEQDQTVPPPDQDSPDNQASDPTPLTTPHPEATRAEEVQRAKEQEQTLNRRRHITSPIGMGREPTNPHPAPTTLLDPNSPSQTSSSAPTQNSHLASPRRTTSSVGIPQRRSSSPGLGDVGSDSQWRREQLERLERKTSRSRRPTPISKRTDTIPPPSDPAQLHFNRGYKHFKQRQFDKALPLFNEALQLEKDNGLYMTLYAYTLFQTDPTQKNEASELLTKAIETGHRQALPDAHLFLGQILKLSGEQKLAYDHFKRAFELNPASQEAEREVRLYERRQAKPQKTRSSGTGSAAEGFFKKLFKK